jgi:hypothetical protein
MAGPTALLVVHGIGAQRPGETLDKLIAGLRLLEPGFTPTTTADGITASFGGQPIRLYEVYWADVLKDDVTHGTFLMMELQSLAWFPLFNMRRGNYLGARYSRLRVTWWSIALPLLNFFVLFGYYGVGLFAEIFVRARQKPAGRITRPEAIDRLLDEYAADVINYVNSSAQAFHRERDERMVPEDVRTAFPRITQRFRDQLIKAAADGCETIQIVAHSLGTVITYHALSEFGVDGSQPDTAAFRAALARVRRLYTIGSPLEKLRFFWPRLLPIVTSSADQAPLQWDNFVSFFDPVSGPIKTFLNWGRVANHRLLGGGFFTGHVVYERSPVFLRALGEGLSGRPVTFKRGTASWLRDVLILGGETLAAPLGLGAVVAVGAALFTVAAMLVPYLLSWTVRWWMPAERWAPVIDTLSFVFLGLMTLTFLVAPATRASRAHSLYWTTKPVPESPVPARSRSL